MNAMVRLSAYLRARRPLFESEMRTCPRGFFTAGIQRLDGASGHDKFSEKSIGNVTYSKFINYNDYCVSPASGGGYTVVPCIK
jgi:hypothetical protein